MRLLLLFGLWMTLAAAATPAAVEAVQVRTRAPENRVVTVYFRVPANYDPKQAGLWRVLVFRRGADSATGSDGFFEQKPRQLAPGRGFRRGSQKIQQRN